jgi:hypothetical protein
MADQEKIKAYYARKGVPTVDGWDRQGVLDSIREGRRRGAATKNQEIEALGELAGRLREVVAEAVPDLNPETSAAVRDVLLATVSYLGAYLIAGLQGGSALSALAYLADDLDQEINEEVPSDG